MLFSITFIFRFFNIFLHFFAAYIKGNWHHIKCDANLWRIPITCLMHRHNSNCDNKSMALLSLSPIRKRRSDSMCFYTHNSNCGNKVDRVFLLPLAPIRKSNTALCVITHMLPVSGSGSLEKIISCTGILLIYLNNKNLFGKNFLYSGSYCSSHQISLFSSLSIKHLVYVDNYTIFYLFCQIHILAFPTI